uniref:Predicted protein n=1 Tax=Hordeum vulgare subsp. vulgare TaxID=112509 RepID=F2DBA1_HORVV|nr:predicted protein [Hordeum vulgare subsp. vulgare]
MSANVVACTHALPKPSLSAFHPKTQKVQERERQHPAAASPPQSNMPPAHSGSTTATACEAMVGHCCLSEAVSEHAARSLDGSFPSGLHTVYTAAATGAPTPSATKPSSASSGRDLSVKPQ